MKSETLHIRDRSGKDRGAYFHGSALLSRRAVLILLALTLPGLWARTADCTSRTNALYLLSLPSGYEALETLVRSSKDSGANTVIIRPANNGAVDRTAVAKTVFFAHAQAMKIFVILPARSLPAVLEQHPGWEDMRYDIRSGTIQPAGKIDLFNEDAIAYACAWIKDIAAYSVDGILFDEDLYYDEVEGMSEQALELYRRKYGSAFSPRTAFKKMKGDRREDLHEEYDESFWKLAELKKERLLLFLAKIRESAQAVNGDVQFLIPLPVTGLFLNEREILARYSLDLVALQQSAGNLFWVSIRHRDIRAQQNLNYTGTIETVSRIVMTSRSLIADPAKMIIAIQTTSGSGRILPISEIEDVSAEAKKAGDTGIAFMVAPEAPLPPALTRKVFRRGE